MKIDIKLLYVMTTDQLSKTDLSEIQDLYSDNPREVFKNLIWIKNIYDRRNVENSELDKEISNFKMKIREDRLSIILDKNAAK